MTPCSRLSDRMPEIAAGADEWSAAEAAHLDSCADCRAEWAIVQTGWSLDAGIGQELDADRLSAAVMARVRSEPVPSRAGAGARWAVALVAAAVALVIWTGGGPRPRAAVARAGGEPTESALVVPELERLSAGELKDVLDAFDGPLSDRSTVAAPGLADLSDQELERVLRAGGV